MTPCRPGPSPGDVPRTSFRRGKASPRGVVWFGARSFWGHLRHFVAAAVAAEDVDSRDWMEPDSPESLVHRVAERLGATRVSDSLVESLGRDVYIDFVADTGDDVSVSAKVAELIFRDYELPDPCRPEERVHAPRGDILFFGGDTAYPVATVEEINNRVVVPFNRVLAEVGDNKPRVLLGIPGNHDWYDGLDGFARMFRRRVDEEEEPQRPSLLPIADDQIDRAKDWAKGFVLGGQRHKQKTLDLDGYLAVQAASYFLLPLTPHFHFLAVDRQLRQIDYRQRRFFSDWLQAHPTVTPVVALPDPVRAFCRPSVSGTAMVEALGLEPADQPHLFLSGDIHHYQRFSTGKSTHVIAGGGGAFLHPAPLNRKRLSLPQVEWPGPNQSRALLRIVPWKVLRGRSGFLPHLAYALLFAPIVGLQGRFIPQWSRFQTGIAVALLVSFLVYALIAGAHRRSRLPAAALAFTAALFTALLPAATSFAVEYCIERTGLVINDLIAQLFNLVLAVFLGAGLFGTYLALLTRLGLERTQAFTALDHPGYKHFVRLRICASEPKIYAWCLGLLDPLGKDETPVVVDHFCFSADGGVDAPGGAGRG